MKTIVKEEERMVIVIIEDTADDALSFILSKNCHMMTRGWLCDEDLMMKLYMKNEYKGIARCHKDDEFDAEKGKEIALAKARAKHAKDFQEKVRLYTSTVRNIIDKLDEKAAFKYERASLIKEAALDL